MKFENLRLNGWLGDCGHLLPYSGPCPTCTKLEEVAEVWRLFGKESLTRKEILQWFAPPKQPEKELSVRFDCGHLAPGAGYRGGSCPKCMMRGTAIR